MITIAAATVAAVIAEDTKMKKILSLLLLAALCAVLFAGCGHEHVWTEATCTAPKTCAECGETEGTATAHKLSEATCTEPSTCKDCGYTDGKLLEHNYSEATCTEASACTVCGAVGADALGHAFSDATCTEAATCSTCGAVEGEALGHNLSEATYYAPATCSVCGETVGEPLLADFEKYGISADLQVGQAYTLNTVTSDGSQPTVGETIISSYEVLRSSEQFQEREGYECHVVTFTTVFSDDVALQYGAGADYTVTDYYNIALFKDAADHSDESFSVYQVLINGVQTPVYAGTKGGFTGNPDGSFTFDLTFVVQKPVGYDGVVVGLNSLAIDTRIENYLYDVYQADQFLLFRIPG